MSRSLLVVLVVAQASACHATPRPQPVLAQHTLPSRDTPRAHVEVDASPEWVPHARRGRAVVTSTSITILDDLRFAPGSAVIEKATLPILDVFAQTMTSNPDLRLVVIRTFAQDVAPAWQTLVADMRARAIVDYVVAKGVSRWRLRPEGVALPPAGVTSRLQFEIAVRAP